MDMNEAVAKAIGAERHVANLTIRALADLAGIPERSLVRILKAERDIKMNQVEQIATALKLYPHEIVEHAELILERAGRDVPTLHVTGPTEDQVTDMHHFKSAREEQAWRDAQQAVAFEGEKDDNLEEGRD